MKALVGTFNQDKALVGAFSVIVQPVVEPMDRFAALLSIHANHVPQGCYPGSVRAQELSLGGPQRQCSPHHAYGAKVSAGIGNK